LLNYSFKMEKVLEYRSNMEKTKVEDYAKINILLNKEKEHLDNLESEYNSKTKKTVSNVSEMKMQLMYKEKLKKQLNSQKEKVDEISTNLEDARGNLIEARKDRKIMEKLKEKDKEKFDAVAASNEQKELDDISIMKYAR
jgi:flagellar protein FliJ